MKLESISQEAVKWIRYICDNYRGRLHEVYDYYTQTLEILQKKEEQKMGFPLYTLISNYREKYASIIYGCMIQAQKETKEKFK